MQSAQGGVKQIKAGDRHLTASATGTANGIKDLRMGSVRT
jgi:hypothetical protein